MLFRFRACKNSRVLNPLVGEMMRIEKLQKFFFIHVRSLFVKDFLIARQCPFTPHGAKQAEPLRKK